jgi:hypothetical protein
MSQSNSAQPNDRGETKALVAGSALRRAALTEAASSPMGELRLKSTTQLDTRLSNNPPICDLCADLPT